MKATTGDQTASVWFMPEVDSLYCPSAELEQWFVDITEVLKTSTENLLVVMSSSCQDHKVVSGEYLRSSIEQQVKRFREILEILFAHRKRMYCIALGDVTGSYFEWAMMCSRLFVVAPDVLLGFPDWDWGYPPMGGACELWVHKKLIKKSFWLKRRCLRAFESLGVFSVSVVSGSYVSSWVSVFNQNSDGVLGKVLPACRDDFAAWDVFADHHFAVESLWRPFVDGEGLRHASAKTVVSKRIREYFEESWQNMWKHALVAGDEESLTESVRGCYMFWQTSYDRGMFPIKHSYLKAFYGDVEQVWSGRVWLDVSAMIPAVKWILLWISRGYRVMLVASSARLLSSRLLSLWQKFLVMMDSQKAHMLQEIYCDWMVLSPEELIKVRMSVQQVWVRCYERSKVHIKMGYEDYRFHLLQSVEWNSFLGGVLLYQTSPKTSPKTSPQRNLVHRTQVAKIAKKKIAKREYKEPDEQGARQCAAFLGGKLVCVSEEMAAESLHLWLRSRFVQELLKESLFYRGGLKELLKVLSHQGWSLVDDKYWMDVVESLQGIWQQHQDILSLLGCESSFPYGGEWKDVLQWRTSYLSSQQDNKGKNTYKARLHEPRYRVEVLQSEYFVMLLLYLGYILLAKGIVTKKEDMECVLFEACGVPEHMGSLFAYADMCGPLMVQEFIHRHFASRDSFLKWPA